MFFRLPHLPRDIGTVRGRGWRSDVIDWMTLYGPSVNVNQNHPQTNAHNSNVLTLHLFRQNHDAINRCLDHSTALATT
jgi:hypothetical protein